MNIENLSLKILGTKASKSVCELRYIGISLLLFPYPPTQNSGKIALPKTFCSTFMRQVKSVQQPEMQPCLHTLTFIFIRGSLGSFTLHPAFWRNHLTQAYKHYRLPDTALVRKSWGDSKHFSSCAYGPWVSSPCKCWLTLRSVMGLLFHVSSKRYPVVALLPHLIKVVRFSFEAFV